MNSQTIVYCVVALLLGMLMANMLKSVCGCNKVVEAMSKGRKPCHDHTDCGPDENCRTGYGKFIAHCHKKMKNDA